MRFFFLNLFIFSSIAISELQEPCAICYEPLTVVYPFYFQCSHNEFHDTCILGPSNNTASPRVEICPMCRALSRALISEEDHFKALSMLKANKLEKFEQLIAGKMIKDVNVVDYVTYLITRGARSAKTIRTMRLKHWHKILPVIANQTHINREVFKAILSLAELSTAHLELVKFLLN